MKKTILPLCFFVLFLSTVSAQELVHNGNFNAGTNNWQILLEDPNLPIKAQVIEHSKDYHSYGLADSYVNTNFVELDDKSAIQQKILTTKSENYTLVFAYTHRPNAGDKQLVITADSKVIYTKTIKDDGSIGMFKYVNAYFKAPSNMTKLSFYAVSLNGAEDQGVLLTDISCKKTAEISIDNPTKVQKLR
ncbi:DUF642 domain-containing protein [Aureispira anguillae]|uniref:DUF642 domain-containing protein n=1 Tax=Aureispira anguillae TaxID=2864201 RepID=A0A915YE02_9BACT|nr:DUF642 domain-containing protein [Aureispira anguillae]BDS11363.1 DUF642 domain-containing protein [Aureispira anguillae]